MTKRVLVEGIKLERDMSDAHGCEVMINKRNEKQNDKKGISRGNKA